MRPITGVNFSVEYFRFVAQFGNRASALNLSFYFIFDINIFAIIIVFLVLMLFARWISSQSAILIG